MAALSRGPSLDLVAPARRPHRRRRRRGHERDRDRARAAWATASAAPTSRTRARSSACDLLGVDAHVGHDAAQPPDRRSTRSSSRPRSRRRNPEVVRRTRARRPGAAARRRAARDRRDARARSRSPGATARRRRRRCSRSILRAAGWHPSFLIGGDLNEVGTNAAFDDGEWLVVEADESDGTFLELAPEAAIVTNVEPDHLDHYGDFAALVDGVRAASSTRVPGSRVALRRRRRRRPPRRRVRARGASSRTGSPTTPTTGSSDYEGGRSGTQFALRARAASRSASIELPVPGRHNAVERGGRRRDRARARRAVRRGRARARRLRRRRPPVPVPRRASTASRSSTTTRTSRARSTR